VRGDESSQWIPLPPNTAVAKVTVAAGKARFEPENQALVWRYGWPRHRWRLDRNCGAPLAPLSSGPNSPRPVPTVSTATCAKRLCGLVKRLLGRVFRARLLGYGDSLETRSANSVPRLSLLHRCTSPRRGHARPSRWKFRPPSPLCVPPSALCNAHSSMIVTNRRRECRYSQLPEIRTRLPRRASTHQKRSKDCSIGSRGSRGAK
jgi:hypothetical protein